MARDGGIVQPGLVHHRERKPRGTKRLPGEVCIVTRFGP